MLRLLPAIRFLGPPAAWGPIRLDRFSPYFEDPRAFGLHSLRPIQAYNFLYPFDADSLGRVAYYFDFDYMPGLNPSGYAAEVIAYVKRWQQQPEMGQLQSVCKSDGSLVLQDTRSDATQPHVELSGLEQAAYELCDSAHSPAQVVDHLRTGFPEVAFTLGQVREYLDSLVANSLMVTDGSRYLSLHCNGKPWRSELWRRRGNPSFLLRSYFGLPVARRWIQRPLRRPRSQKSSRPRRQ
jgi:hypothetical protein